MSNLAIQVESLSKQYRIGAEQARYKTMRDSLMDGLSAPLRRLRSAFRPSNVRRSNHDFIWALKNVSFEVGHGETLGIIGRNGAGKSTLLKILSRITEPTEGCVNINGRVASMLEVGTGFHPELTGQENIYLNGAILGMKQVDIKRKFDEIVAFSEVERFISTPIKYYSSGMQLRLAFAVAAHLDPEILLIDEVLAVGDLAFRDKCFKHMRSLRERGVTILVVSHYLAQVGLLTRRCIWLDYGAIRLMGDTSEVLAAYSNELSSGSGNVTPGRQAGQQASTGKIEFAYVRTVDCEGRPCDQFTMGEDVGFEIGVRVHEPVQRVCAGIAIYTHDGVKVLIQNSVAIEELHSDATIHLRLAHPPFLAGQYDLWAGMKTIESDSADLVTWPKCCAFSVLVPSVSNPIHLTYSDPLGGSGMFHWEGTWDVAQG